MRFSHEILNSGWWENSGLQRRWGMVGWQYSPARLSGTDWPKLKRSFLYIFWRPWRNSGREGSRSAWNRQFSWGPQQICVTKTALPPNVMQELGNKIDIAKPTVVLISAAQRSSSLGGMKHFWEVRSWIYLSGESGIYWLQLIVQLRPPTSAAGFSTQRCVHSFHFFGV